jgi:hypothetical protein
MAKSFGKFGGPAGAMHKGRGVTTQKPGVASQEGSTGLSGGAGDPQAGPAGAGFYKAGPGNKDYAGTQAPGTSGPSKSGGNGKFAVGGKGSMFSNRGSTPARGGSSSV